MADATKKYTVRNTQAGIRGLNTVSGYRDLAPGETAENVELTTAEYESAKRTNYFAFGADAEAAAGEGGEGDALPGTHAELDKLAGSMPGFSFPDGTRTVADKQAAITAARAATADGTGGGVPTPTAPTDDLDNMSDDDLRNTASAISGKPVAELTDTSREDLLKLARGES
jgi:hypothetical protein